MMSFRVILRNGAEFTVKAEDLSIERNTITGELVSYSFTGITENKPCYLNISEVAAIVRLLSDETQNHDQKLYR